MIRTARLLILAVLALLAALSPSVHGADEKPPLEGESVFPPAADPPRRSPAIEDLYKRTFRGDEGKAKIKDVPTKISVMLGGKVGLAPQGRVSEVHTYDSPLYGDGWSDSQGFDLALGVDVGFLGFFVDVGFDRFDSRGTTAKSPGWYKYGNISYFTLCPGLRIKFPFWLKNAYAGDAPWAMEWYDYMLNAYPYVKVAFGPALLLELEKATDANPAMATYWEYGLSFTAAATVGLQWMPFEGTFGLFFEFGVQFLVPLTDLGSGGVGSSPEALVTFPIKVGLALEF